MGELHIGRQGLARGYLHKPALTAERFIPNPFDLAFGARMYRTGDLAKYRDDGSIDFLGRSDRQFNLRGFRIEAGEVEAAINSLPLVAESAVELDYRGPETRLVAYVACKRSSAEYRDIQESARREHFGGWREFYEQSCATSVEDDRWNLTGWVSTFTGHGQLPVAISAMRCHGTSTRHYCGK